MDYADLAELLQVIGRSGLCSLFLMLAFMILLSCLQMSKIERMQLQNLCDEVVSEFDAASQQVHKYACCLLCL
jgi:hypothetical protein